MDQNRRQFTRISFRSPARLILPDGVHTVDISDLSLKGALVRPSAPLNSPIGTQGVLRVQLDDGTTEIRMGIAIAHHENDLYGLACREIDIDSVTHLRRLVTLNAGDDALLTREIALLSTS
ncbi:PilZ domain-containing protein [Azonexus sp.]|uniref:PilZ domain-containing protein n=1 Tax=Azonexus sp. TaxID=1872668 RepID=UPI0039E4C452